jgi:hypothetical protein
MRPHHGFGLLADQKGPPVWTDVHVPLSEKRACSSYPLTSAQIQLAELSVAAGEGLARDRRAGDEALAVGHPREHGRASGRERGLGAQRSVRGIEKEDARYVFGGGDQRAFFVLTSCTPTSPPLPE